MDEIILQVTDLHKYFGPVKALQGVNLKLYEAKAMALLGENGAGKSTIIKCISGIHKPNEGIIKIFGNEIKFSNTKDSIKAGIAVVHQELQLCNNLSIYENIWLGRNIKKFGIIDHKSMIEKSKEILKVLDVNLNPKLIVSDLTIAEQQMVEIAKALSLGAKILILDEPTDALSEKEANTLFKIIKNLKREGIGILYVTHRMEEIKKICEYYTIFKDGKYVTEGKVANTTIDKIIEGMIGRKLEEQFPKITSRPKKEFINIENISNKYIYDISLKIYSGEILGIAGLVGSGRTEFAKTLIGEFKKNHGNVSMGNININNTTIKKSISNRIYYVTEDRKKNGLILDSRIDDNIVISNLDKISNKLKLINYQKIKKEVEKLKKDLNIKFHKQSDKISSLSGGNQQKILLSKALFTKPNLLILDEPTRGVDVGARKEIYKIIANYASKGKAIVIISSDLPEIIGISERVAVFREGKLSGILLKEKINEKQIINLAVRGIES